MEITKNHLTYSVKKRSIDYTPNIEYFSNVKSPFKLKAEVLFDKRGTIDPKGEVKLNSGAYAKIDRANKLIMGLFKEADNEADNILAKIFADIAKAVEAEII